MYFHVGAHYVCFFVSFHYTFRKQKNYHWSRKSPLPKSRFIPPRNNIYHWSRKIQKYFSKKNNRPSLVQKNPLPYTLEVEVTISMEGKCRFCTEWRIGIHAVGLARNMPTSREFEWFCLLFSSANMSSAEASSQDPHRIPMNPPFYCLKVLGRMKTHNGGSNGVCEPEVCRKTFALPDCMRILFEKNYRPILVEFWICMNVLYAVIACHCSLPSLIRFSHQNTYANFYTCASSCNSEPPWSRDSYWTDVKNLFNTFQPHRFQFTPSYARNMANTCKRSKFWTDERCKEQLEYPASYNRSPTRRRQWGQSAWPVEHRIQWWSMLELCGAAKCGFAECLELNVKCKRFPFQFSVWIGKDWSDDRNSDPSGSASHRSWRPCAWSPFLLTLTVNSSVRQFFPLTDVQQFQEVPS